MEHNTDLVSYVAWSTVSDYSKTFLENILYTLNYKHRIFVAQLYTHRSQAIFYSRWSDERDPARAQMRARRRVGSMPYTSWRNIWDMSRYTCWYIAKTHHVPASRSRKLFLAPANRTTPITVPYLQHGPKVHKERLDYRD